MKRILLISLLLVLALSVSFGQIAYKQGDQVASVMIGFGSTVYTSDATSTVPPLSATFDYGYNENISLGGIISYTGSKYEWSGYGYGYKYTWSYLIIAARGAYHYDLLHNSKIDTYGGVALGYDIASSSATYNGNWGYLGQPSAESSGGVLFGLYVVGRYYFSPNLAAQLELGYGIAYFNIGIAYKF
jgi:hypothetical protein